MKGALGAPDGDPVADTEAGVGGVDHCDDTGRAVTQRAGDLEPIAHFFHGRTPTQSAGGVQDFADLVWARSRLLQQVHARLLDFHFLRADADDGVGEAHQNAPRRSRGQGNILQFEAAVLILGNLLQSSSPAVGAAEGAACAVRAAIPNRS